MATNVSKTINYSTIKVQKEDFDLAFGQGMASQDPDTLQIITQRITYLQRKIYEKMENASSATMTVSRFFTLGTPEPTVDMNAINEEITEKVRLFFVHIGQVSANPTPQPLTGRTTVLNTPTTQTTTTSPSTPTTTSTITLPTTQTTTTTTTTSVTTQQPTLNVRELATGYRNLRANCWANSLLSSFIVNIPSFRQAYETVAKHYAQNGLTEEDRTHGRYLQAALEAYDNALVLTEPVDPQATQNVRLAFNYFFGRVDRITGNQIFSRNEYAHEDAWEAMQMIMGAQQAIHRNQGIALPSLYCPLQAKRHYRPVGEPSAAGPGDVENYSRVAIDNTSTVISSDYQVILEIQNRGHLSFDEQLLDWFRSPAVMGSEPATHIRSDGQKQSFELIATSNQFIQIPEELILTIKRFTRNSLGFGIKISDPVQIKRIIPLPCEATTENTPIAYELDAFIVHSGGFGSGHYIGYKKLQGRWIETNDGAVRFLTDEQIDRILQGQHGATYTSYCHHYTRIPQTEQAEALRIAISAQTLQRFQNTNTPITVLIEKYTKDKQTYETLLQKLKTYTQGVVANEDNARLASILNSLDSPIIDTLRHVVWINDNVPNVYDYGTNTLNANPKKLQEIQHPWLIASNGSLDAQMDIILTMKLQIVTENLKKTLLIPFANKLDGPFTTNEELLIALKALPEHVQWDLHGLVYKAHKMRLGEKAVDQREYGRNALENGNIGKVLREAKETVLNIYGKNIVEQLVTEYKNRANKIQTRYEMMQLQAFHELLTKPTEQISREQLRAAFERLDVRKELKEKIYLLIWLINGSPEIPNYGTNTFKEDPHCILGMRKGLIATPPVCNEGVDILEQLIALLARDSK